MMWVILTLALIAGAVWGDEEVRGAIATLAVFAVIGTAAYLTRKKDTNG